MSENNNFYRLTDLWKNNRHFLFYSNFFPIKTSQFLNDQNQIIPVQSRTNRVRLKFEGCVNNEPSLFISRYPSVMVCKSIILIGFFSVAPIASGIRHRTRDVPGRDPIVLEANVSKI